MPDKITVTADSIPGTPTFAITATLVDDAGQPIAGEKISFKIEPPKAGKVEPKETDTDAAGTASATLTPKAGVTALAVIAESTASTDRKEITIMSELDTKQKELVEAKQKLQEQLALAAKLEQEVQKLQEAEQMKAKAALLAQADQYAKTFKDLDLAQRLADLEAALKRLADKVKPNADEAKLKQVEERRAKVDADIKARQAQVDKLKQERDQLDKDVESATKDVKNRQQELDDKQKALDEFNQQFLKPLETAVAKSDTDFNKDDKALVLRTWVDALDHKNTLDKDVKPKLVSPDDFRKDLENKQKALDEAKEKLRQQTLKQAEKQAEHKQASDALQALDRNAAITDFIKLIAA